jgi:hypothetical protein
VPALPRANKSGNVSTFEGEATRAATTPAAARAYARSSTPHLHDRTRPRSAGRSCRNHTRRRSRTCSSGPSRQAGDRPSAGCAGSTPLRIRDRGSRRPDTTPQGASFKEASRATRLRLAGALVGEQIGPRARHLISAYRPLIPPRPGMKNSTCRTTCVISFSSSRESSDLEPPPPHRSARDCTRRSGGGKSSGPSASCWLCVGESAPARRGRACSPPHGPAGPSLRERTALQQTVTTLRAPDPSKLSVFVSQPPARFPMTGSRRHPHPRPPRGRSLRMWRLEKSGRPPFTHATVKACAGVSTGQ